MRAILAACLILTAGSALADSTTGTVAIWDASTHRLTLADRTVWMLPADTAMPDKLQPGDRLAIAYVSNADNGWQKILSITRTEARRGTGG